MNGLAETIYIVEHAAHTSYASTFKMGGADAVHGVLRRKHEEAFDREHWKYRKLAAIAGMDHDQTKHLQ